jgi:hypothetical protein
MDLQLASVWLEREHVGFSDIHQFANLCRNASLTGTREAAALVLLAERAASFNERYEGIAVTNELVTEFLTEIRRETIALKQASADSDAKFIEALNLFAAQLAPMLFV